MTVEIGPVALDQPGFAPLLAEAVAGDGPFLKRLADEWESGALRFDRPGEVLLGAFAGGRLVGLGGISLDPYGPAPGLCRLRHVYVLRAERGQGVAASLVSNLLAHAREHFDTIRLSTQSEAAGRLYERAGFKAAEAIKQTHRMRL